MDDPSEKQLVPHLIWMESYRITNGCPPGQMDVPQDGTVKHFGTNVPLDASHLNGKYK
jgi:hypothetical protein